MDGAITGFSERTLVFVAAERLLAGEHPVAVLAFIKRHVKLMEAK